MIDVPPGDQAPPAPTCPFCREVIRPGARKCPHCQEYLDPALLTERQAAGRTPLLAVFALVTGLLSPLLMCLPGPIAVVLGLAALLRRGTRRGRGMAIAGLVIGVFATIGLVLILGSVVAALEKVGLDPSGSSPAEPLF